MKLRKYAAGAFIALAAAGTLALATPAHGAEVAPTSTMATTSTTTLATSAHTAEVTEVAPDNALCNMYINNANIAMERHQYFWSIGEFELADQALAQYRYWMNLYNASC